MHGCAIADCRHIIADLERQLAIEHRCYEEACEAILDLDAELKEQGITILSRKWNKIINAAIENAEEG